MGEKVKMEVKIRGKYYTVVADEAEEYIYKICSYVDKKVTEIADMNPRLGTEMASILTAINTADELYKKMESEDNLRNQILEYGKEITKLERRIKELEEKLGEKSAEKKTAVQNMSEV